MRRHLLMMAAVVAIGGGMAARAQGPPALVDHATRDDFFFTKALSCYVERCAGEVADPGAGAAAAWNALRDAGYGAPELLDAACGTAWTCAGERFGATLRSVAESSRRDGATPAVAATDPAGAEGPLAIPVDAEGSPAIPVDAEGPLAIPVDATPPATPPATVTPPPPPPPPRPPPRRGPPPPRKDLFLAPTIQVSLGLQGWFLPVGAWQARLLRPGLTLGWLLDVALVRGTLTWGLGTDDDAVDVASVDVGIQAGPLFGDGAGRVYLAGSGGWHLLGAGRDRMRTVYGGVELGVLARSSRLTLLGAYVNTHVHGVLPGTSWWTPDGWRDVTGAGGLSVELGVRAGF